jgi:hypothetical protein
MAKDPSALEAAPEMKDAPHPVLPAGLEYEDDGECIEQEWSHLNREKRSKGKGRNPVNVDVRLLAKLAKTGLSVDMIADVLGVSRPTLDEFYAPILKRGREACARRTIAYLEFWAARGKEYALKVLVARHLGWKAEESPSNVASSSCTIAIQTSDGKVFVTAPKKADVEEYAGTVSST